jgi:hypothetical protein
VLAGIGQALTFMGLLATVTVAAPDAQRSHVVSSFSAATWLGGAPLLEVFPVLAIAGNMALGAAVMSYAGQLNLTAVADRDRCPDVQVFADGVRRALAELAR